MPANAKAARNHLRTLADANLAKLAQRFFKTGAGEYGEGDKFLGIRVPVLRAETKRFADLPLAELQKLIRSPLHEERMFALLILVHQFARAHAQQRKEIYDFYLKNTEYINNWDLVDCSAHKIVGEFLKDKSRAPLYELARSPVMWHRRIAMIASFQLIKASDYSDALGIAGLLLQDKEDLIHKAVGWMLREVGKRDRVAVEAFLVAHYKCMPRTMLRYAVEKFPASRRQAYLAGQV